MENQIKEQMLKMAHDLLNMAEAVCSKNDELQNQCNQLANENLALSQRASEMRNTDVCAWVSVDDDEKPLDYERVAVHAGTTCYMCEYDAERGFMKNVVAWMRLPEFGSN